MHNARVWGCSRAPTYTDTHTYTLARIHARAQDIGAKGGRKVTAPWEYLDLREAEGAGRGTGRRAEATQGSWLVGASRSRHNWLTSRATTHSKTIQNDRPATLLVAKDRGRVQHPLSVIYTFNLLSPEDSRKFDRLAHERPIFSPREIQKRRSVSFSPWKFGDLMVPCSKRRFFSISHPRHRVINVASVMCLSCRRPWHVN